MLRGVIGNRLMRHVPLAQVAGPRSSVTQVNDAAVGTNAWTDPANAAASDDSRATSVVAAGSALTNYLKCTNFGFTIPTNATIKGVVVEVERSVAAGATGTATDSTVSLVKGGAVTGANKADAAAWLTVASEAYQSYGSSADLWATTLTPAEVNSADFGVVLSAAVTAITTAQVDHVRVTVHYSL